LERYEEALSNFKLAAAIAPNEVSSWTRQGLMLSTGQKSRVSGFLSRTEGLMLDLSGNKTLYWTGFWLSSSLYAASK
jgi:hypothetical protein